MAKSLLKIKNYDVHSVGVNTDDKINFNIIAWATQTAMGGKRIVVAFYKPDLTIELVKSGGNFSLQFLAEDQTNLISKLGRQSGRENKKLNRLVYAIDSQGFVFLPKCIGYLRCQVLQWADGGDHELAICQVLSQVWLHPEKKLMTLNGLREKKLIRG